MGKPLYRRTLHDGRSRDSLGLFQTGTIRWSEIDFDDVRGVLAKAESFGLRYGVPMIYDLGLRKIFLLTYVLWLPLLGWTAYFARRTSQKLMLLAALAVICPVSATLGGNWTGAWVMNMVQIPVMAVLLFLPAIRLPRLVLPGLMLIAASSYHIYLFHLIIPELLKLGSFGGWGIAASVVIGAMRLFERDAEQLRNRG